MALSFEKINSNIDELLDRFATNYVYIIIVFHVLYAMVFVGVISLNSAYIQAFNIVMQLMIGIFLIFRFHPFREHKLRPNDGKIIFGCAVFLLFNLGAVEITNVFLNKNIKSSTNL